MAGLVGKLLFSASLFLFAAIQLNMEMRWNYGKSAGKADGR